MNCRSISQAIARIGFVLSLFITLLAVPQAMAQDLDLAEQYYAQQEWEKALSMYEKLSKDEQLLDKIHDHYLDCMMALEDYKAAGKYLKKRLKDAPLNPRLRTDQALLLKASEGDKAMNEYLSEYLATIKRDDSRLKVLGIYLIHAGMLERAEEAYLQGVQNKREPFFFELAELYKVWGKKDKMFAAYLDMLAGTNVRQSIEDLEEVEGRLGEDLTDPADFALLEQLLYKYLQQQPEQLAYNELLVWLYLQQKNFSKAFTQAKAIDRRIRAGGSKIMQIGDLSFDNGAYEEAVKIYGYLVERYANEGFIYMNAKNMLIKSKEELVRSVYPIDIAAIQSLADDYRQVIDEFGIRGNIAEAVQSLARLQAFYLGQHDEAIATLNELITQPRMPRNNVDAAKLDLGDIYVLKEEPWEAALIYAQVEKSQKDQPLGHSAKLRSAKLSFYTGDFKLAKAHLDVLKLATSREIANDAMDLSLIIQDNLELDTSAAALQEYANIELLIFQGVYTEALKRYTKMLKRFPGHRLTDEILWEQANIFVKLGQFNDAAEVLEKLLADHDEDILGDDATFLAARLYEEELDNLERAKELYLQLLSKHAGSIYIPEARKRARRLRGDRQ